MMTNMDTAAEERFGVDRESLGPVLHQALRKGCDSRLTSLAYNIICLLQEPDWSEYLDLVWAGLATCQSPREIPAMLKHMGQEIGWGTPSRSALRLTFDLFTDLDWLCYACYFGNPGDFEG